MSESTVNVNNSSFANQDKRFQTACMLAGTSGTRRQASKFRRGTGIAYATMRHFLSGGYAEERHALERENILLDRELVGKKEVLDSISTTDEPTNDEDKKVRQRAIDLLEARIDEIESKIEENENWIEELDADYEVLSK